MPVRFNNLSITILLLKYTGRKVKKFNKLYLSEFDYINIFRAIRIPLNFAVKEYYYTGNINYNGY